MINWRFEKTFNKIGFLLSKHDSLIDFNPFYQEFWATEDSEYNKTIEIVYIEKLNYLGKVV